MSKPRLLFASYHAYLDDSSGAALSTRDLFEDLTAHGWECRVACGPRFDSEDARGPAAVLATHQLRYAIERCAPPGGPRYEVFHYAPGGVPVVQFWPEGYQPTRPTDQNTGVAFLDMFERACIQFRPDVVLTYGGPPIAPHLIHRAKRQGAKVVFALHNFSYLKPDGIREADAFRVPSEFARKAYRERAGLEAEAVEYPRNLERVLADRVAGRYVTFVNPQPMKGVAWFARIVQQMGIVRPDIHFLVVEGRGGVRWLDRVKIDLSSLQTINGLHTTPFPRDFYGISRVVLMPSVWEETFGRVAAEALANGLPVLASDRGALPETLGGAGFVFHIPERYTPTDLAVPTAEEVAPWVEAVERLWDDDEFYAGHRARAMERAKVWDADRLRPGVEAFFRRVADGA